MLASRGSLPLKVTVLQRNFLEERITPRTSCGYIRGLPNPFGLYRKACNECSQIVSSTMLGRDLVLVESFKSRSEPARDGVGAFLRYKKQRDCPQPRRIMLGTRTQCAAADRVGLCFLDS